jgi:hypothetical protein
MERTPPTRASRQRNSTQKAMEQEESAQVVKARVRKRKAPKKSKKKGNRSLPLQSARHVLSDDSSSSNSGIETAPIQSRMKKGIKSITKKGIKSAPKARTKKANIGNDSDSESATPLFPAKALHNVIVKARLFCMGVREELPSF